MRGMLLLILFCCATPKLYAQTSTLADTVSGLELHSAFLPNLHHLLHAEARDFKNRLDTVQMSRADTDSWQVALAYYRNVLAPKDLRRSKGMPELMDLLSTDAESVEDPTIDANLRRALNTAAPIYRKYRWLADDAANRKYIADVAKRIRKIAPAVLPRLAAFYHEPWYDPSTPVRVDFVNVGEARGAYTWVRGRVHSVVDIAEPAYQDWHAAEMLLHEASHGLTAWLENAISAAADSAHKDPDLLWHTMQFYVVGELLRRTLERDGAQFTPYMYATGLFDRAWKRYRPGVERWLTAYLNGEVSLQTAINQIVRET